MSIEEIMAAIRSLANSQGFMVDCIRGFGTYSSTTQNSGQRLRKSWKDSALRTSWKWFCTLNPKI